MKTVNWILIAGLSISSFKLHADNEFGGSLDVWTEKITKVSANWKQTGTVDTALIRSIDRDFLMERMRIDMESVRRRGAVSDLWLRLLEEIPQSLLPDGFLAEIASVGSGVVSRRPSISHSAWVLLAQRIVATEASPSEFFNIAVNEDGCPVGYLTALGLLAENGYKEAIARLIERSEFADIDSMVCAELAVKGLLVAAYRDENSDALRAVEEFNEAYISTVTNQ